MARFRLNRRAALRGMGLGMVSIGLPRLEAMLNERGNYYDPASAQGLPEPKRLIMMHWPQGVPTGWAPGPGGPFYPSSGGADYALTRCLEPLAAHKADFNLVSGLTYDQLYLSFDSHGHAISVTTGMRPDPDAKIARGTSVDKIVGQALGAGTRFSSIAAGIYDQGDGFYTWENNGGDIKYSPIEVNPATLFDSLFGGATLDPDEGQILVRRQQSVLDSVKSDITRLQGRLGVADNRRLDEYLASIRELEKSITAPIGANCALPAKPGALKYTDADAAEYAKLMIDLLVMAVRCDMTRSVFFSLGGVWRTYPFLDILTDYHNVCHSGFNESASKGPRLDDGPNPTATRAEYYTRIATWHMEMVAYMLAQLKASDGSAPPLLDSSVFAAFSEFGDGGLHYQNYVPFLVAGKAGRGASGMKTGQNLVFPCSYGDSFTNSDFCKSLQGTPNRCTNDVWQSALMALGVYDGTQKFGEPELATKPLEGLWI
jgi:hypothetical protein